MSSSLLLFRGRSSFVAVCVGLVIGVSVFVVYRHFLFHPPKSTTKRIRSNSNKTTNNSDPSEQEAETAEMENVTEEFSVSATGAWKGQDAKSRHAFDPYLLDALVKFFYLVGANSVMELGAGMGSYSKGLQAEGIFVSCYDGNPNTQDLTKGLCAVLDLSKPIHLSKHDWVLSLEVGEHLPEEFEKYFLYNLDRGNTHGVIISWAVEGQGGTSHVNTRNNSYLRGKFDDMGYESMYEAEKALRKAAWLQWFNYTIMVYKRRE